MSSPKPEVASAGLSTQSHAPPRRAASTTPSLGCSRVSTISQAGHLGSAGQVASASRVRRQAEAKRKPRTHSGRGFGWFQRAPMNRRFASIAGIENSEPKTTHRAMMPAVMGISDDDARRDVELLNLQTVDQEEATVLQIRARLSFGRQRCWGTCKGCMSDNRPFGRESPTGARKLKVPSMKDTRMFECYLELL